MTYPIKSLKNCLVNGYKFDVDLSPAQNFNLDLTITLRLWLVQESRDKNNQVKDTDGKAYEASVWPHEEWMQFRATYQAEGQKFWDNWFWLSHLNHPDWGGLDFPYDQSPGNACVSGFPIPPTGFGQVPLQMPNGSTTSGIIPASGISRPAINCRFRLQLVSHQESYHTGVRVAYLKKNWDKPSLTKEFRSHSKLNADQDLTETYTTTQSKTEGKIEAVQKPFLHEIGHLLGQPHAGQASVFDQAEPACLVELAKNPKNGANAEACYGQTFDSYRNIMGGGAALSLRNALPWQMALAQLTNTSPTAWPVSLRPQPATILPAKPSHWWH
jgi:hypothetical protein